MIQPFSITRLPRIEFGSGVFGKLPELIVHYGRRVLCVTGGNSFLQTGYWHALQERLREKHIAWEQCSIEGEPSPVQIDEIVDRYREHHFDVVVGIGGGSPMDAAKAIAGLLRIRHSVMDYLEGVGPELPYIGPGVPFIAVPTTAGTGSEATKNSVLSVQGPDGFKKSFRDEKLVAEYALVDPDLLATCPAALIAANGMDALTQLMESYVSTRANIFTDALTIGALRGARDALLTWYEHGAEATEAQQRMAYAALISGVNLAQTGLGSVHGLASPLGAFYPIPHGEVCGMLVAAATRVNIEAMCAREPQNPGLEKYARLGNIFGKRKHDTHEQAWGSLLHYLESLTERLQLPRLASYGIQAAELDHVVANSRGSSMNTNPIVLTDTEVRRVLEMRL